jgi:hypothetical protein
VKVVNYPYFLDMSRDQAIEIGTNASIRCLVSDPTNAIVFWTFDQKPVLPSERITLHEQDTLLEVGNFTETDNGIYSCHLSNPMNNEISTFSFKVFASGKQWINRDEFISFQPRQPSSTSGFQTLLLKEQMPNCIAITLVSRFRN